VKFGAPETSCKVCFQAQGKRMGLGKHQTELKDDGLISRNLSRIKIKDREKQTDEKRDKFRVRSKTEWFLTEKFP